MSTLTSDDSSPSANPTRPQAIALSVLASIACVLCIPLLVLHTRARNFALVVLILSFTLLNLQNVINSIIWHNDDTESWWSGHVLCDIETKMQIGFMIVVPGAATSICRHLALILDTGRTAATAPSIGARRTRLVFETTLCIVFPVYLMAIHIRVQPYRYHISSIAGCESSLDASLLAVILVLAWPMLVCLLGTAYSIVIIVRLARYRRQVSSLLTHSGSTTSRFTRLFVIAVLFLAVCTPLSIYGFVRSLGTSASASAWEDVHPPYWSTLIIKEKNDPGALRDRWIQVAAGYVIVAIFGSVGDALSMYGRWAAAVSSVCGLRPSRQAQQGGPGLSNRSASVRHIGGHSGNFVESSTSQEVEFVLCDVVPDVRVPENEAAARTEA